jgi:hypothetical protein
MGASVIHFLCSSYVRRGLSAMALLLLAACSAPPPNQFADFAKLGTALADSTPPLLDAAFNEAVATDSLVLIDAREGIADPDERLDKLERSNELLSERLAIYGDLIRHSQLLRSYFLTLGMLADTSGDSRIGDGAKGIVDQLQALHPKLRGASIGDLAVADFVKAAAPAAVGAFRSVALKRELEARAKTIAGELDLQQAVLTAIAEQMRVDIKTRLTRENAVSIDLPFADPGPLPGDWADRRLRSLQAPITLRAVDAAAAAAENLRLSFIALTEGGGAAASLTQLLQDVSTVVSLVEILNKPTP